MKQGIKQYLGIKDVKHLRFLLELSEREWNVVLTEPERFFCEFKKEIKGKVRDLVDIKPPLKAALKKLNTQLQAIHLPSYMQGGVKGRSAVTNAFFPSIGFHHVQTMCRKRLKCSVDVAKAMATICTYKDTLPQGSPTSTMMANFVIEHLAYRLHKLSEKHGAKYSQYVDDIVISGPEHVEGLKPLVVKIIQEEGFICHPDKLVVFRKGEEHVVTGVRVDHGKDVPSKNLQSVRAAIEATAGEAEYMAGKNRRSLDGKIRHVATLNPGTGKFLKRRLSRIEKKNSSTVSGM